MLAARAVRSHSCQRVQYFRVSKQCMVLHKAWYCSKLHLHGVAQSMVLQCTAFAWCCTKLGLTVYRITWCIALHGAAATKHGAWSCTKHDIACSVLHLHAVDQRMVLQYIALHGALH